MRRTNRIEFDAPNPHSVWRYHGIWHVCSKRVVAYAVLGLLCYQILLYSPWMHRYIQKVRIKYGAGDGLNRFTEREIQSFYMHQTYGFNQKKKVDDVKIHPKAAETCISSHIDRPYGINSKGYTCLTKDVDKSLHQPYENEACDVVAPFCCIDYDSCVSYCLKPENMQLKEQVLASANRMHPFYSLGSQLSTFSYCSYKCRTSSASLVSQNSYRSTRVHCYGRFRPNMELPSVNSEADPYSRAETAPKAVPFPELDFLFDS